MAFDLALQLFLLGEFPLQSDPHKGGFTDPRVLGSPVQLAVQVRGDLNLDPAGSCMGPGRDLRPHFQQKPGDPPWPGGTPRSRDRSASEAAPGGRN